VREFAANVPVHVEAAIKRALSRSRDERFESIASFMAAIRGEADSAALDRPSLSSDEMPAVGASPGSASDRTAAGPSKTTLSEAASEAKAADGEDMLLQASRTPRWPLYAGGGAAAVGLMLFLLLRPSHEAAPQATPATLKVAAPEPAVVAAVLPARQEAPRDAGMAAPVVLPSQVASGTTAAVVTEARPSAKLAHAGAASSNRRHARAAKETFPHFQRPVAAPSASYSPPPPSRRQDDPAGF
jgi:hypothetical protein